MVKQLKHLGSSARAQGMTEYIIIVALIALVAVAGVKMFGGKIAQLFQDKAKQIETETGGSASGNGQ
jgi:Flp pilus assembly pilin Flp